GISKAAAGVSNAPVTLNLNDTTFVVAKYAFSPGANDDTVSLWINPLSFGGAEPAANVSAVGSGIPDASGLLTVFLRANSSGNSGVSHVDNLRVGSAWPDVAPGAGTSPYPSYSKPYVVRILNTQGEVELTGSNGTPNAFYQVLQSS